MKLSKSVRPISYLKQNAAKVVREVHENHSSIVITQNGEAKAVLMDLAEYEQGQESLAMLKMIAQSKAAFSNGNFNTAKKTFADIRNRNQG